jgi:alkanesulfonate monooxygenase SsuD/methylene tetrahydromethanopterin reductase-like flavin-dependent oxidoreductase (luciferase family)
MEMAAEAEEAGWDAFFLWDHVSWNPDWGGSTPIADPWVCLAAAATATSRMQLGTMVTPLARRRPQKLARELVSLDQLSEGRAVLGVGLGDDFEYRAFGESLARRGARLDEALAVLRALLSGEPVDFDGDHYVIHSPPTLPLPVHGHVPIWVGGHWPNSAPFARAARFDGVVPRKQNGENGGFLTVEDFVAIRAAVGRDDDNFAYVVSGSTTSPTDLDMVQVWQEAGANWWLEALHPWGADPGAMRDRLRAGPPKI